MASVVPKPSSRPTSRSSYRAPSPAGSVDSVGRSRTREERASTLEKLSRGSVTPQQQRTFSPGITSPSSIPIPIPSSAPTTPIASKTRRTSSFDKLSAITAAGGTESLIPLPVRATPTRRGSSPTLNGTANGHLNGLNGSSGIPEGVPIEFGVASPSLGASRSISPTRTLSRIPVSSVGHARTLADEGQRRAPSPTTPGGDTSLLGDTSFRSSMSSTSMLGLSPNPGSSTNGMPVSPTPGYRRSLVGGGTTKVLADLQAHTLQVKSVLENTKSQLRASQRTIAQLTRQTEDLKDGRERLRLENESLNNVVSRKERLLQERQKMDKLYAEQRAVQEEFATEFKAQLYQALDSVEKSSKDCNVAGQTAKDVADELARLKRLIHSGPGGSKE
ncbi:hypothetical protein FRC07_003437 [Ceratobasidium sp. 392]|nr:hypothetical protein FRC07_003437 [Ceratobasidium sp. 392]